MATLIDSYSENYYTTSQALRTGGIIRLGQSFIGNGYKLSSCKFYLCKAGLPTGNIYGKIYAHTGTFGTGGTPTGAALATSDAFDVATLATSFYIKEFTFTGAAQITLTNGTNYFVILEANVGDSDNYTVLGLDTITKAHAGNAARTTGIFWTADSSYDCCFYVYGNLATNIKSVAGVPYASISKICGIPITSIKSIAGVS